MKDKLEEEVLARQSRSFRLVKLELMLLEWEHFKVEHWNPTQAVILHLLSNCNNCHLLQPPLVGSPSTSYYEADDEGDGIPVPLPSARSRRPLTPFPSSIRPLTNCSNDSPSSSRFTDWFEIGFQAREREGVTSGGKEEGGTNVRAFESEATGSDASDRLVP